MFKAKVLRSGGGYDTDVVSSETGLSCEGDKGLTQQQFAEECDINTIVRRFGLTGELPQNLRMPVSADFGDVIDFHTAMNIVRKSEEQFLKVPAEIRARFANDPGQFLSFFEDPTNADEARKMGLMNPLAEVARVDPPVKPVA